MKFSYTIHSFKYIPKDNRWDDNIVDEEDMKENKVLSYYSDTIDELNKLVPRVRDLIDKNKSTKQDVIRNMAIYETRLKFSLLEKRQFFGKEFDELTHSSNYSLDNFDMNGVELI